MKLYTGKYKNPFSDEWKYFYYLQVKDISKLIERSEKIVWEKLSKGSDKLEFKSWKGKESLIMKINQIK